jgi:type IV pilus assembly protein PilA
MKGLLKKYHKGEGGFTLVELLVVVAILGVIAAVAVLAVTRFMGSGNVESANTELHQAQTAIAAVMADAGNAQLDAADTGWNGGVGAANNEPTATVGVIVYGAATYIHGTFNATYDYNVDGDITNATNVSWSGVVWDGVNREWDAA